MGIIKHTAIIMDGNGRWATEKRWPRGWGHIRGARVVSEIVEAAVDYGLDSLTLYTFSTENWSRPEDEVRLLFKLLLKFLRREKHNIIKNNISFRILGDISSLNEETKEEIISLENETKENQGLKLSFAFSYGGRKEILDSVNTFIKENPGKTISEEDLSSSLYRPEIGDVDLLIRTGGDQRISNFLLWQVTYAELYFSKTKWPDFTKNEFLNTLKDKEHISRRFGSLNNNGSFNNSKTLADLNKKNYK